VPAQAVAAHQSTGILKLTSCHTMTQVVLRLQGQLCRAKDARVHAALTHTSPSTVRTHEGRCCTQDKQLAMKVM
jgi:hypothetical protein